MSMQEKNSFTLRMNRFINPVTVDKSFSCIQMKKNLKSVHIDKQLFTNYSKSMASNKYRLVKDVWEKYKNNSDITNECMIADEIINEKKKIDRLKEIIFQNTGKNITKVEIVNNVYKFKHKQDKEVQFYFYYDGKILNLLLVDLFHLGIPALKNGVDVSERQYLNNKRNRCCLSNIVNN